MVTINGSPVEAAGQSLLAYLKRAGFEAEHIAVERNGEIVPRANLENVVLQENDVVEVVQFVGGG